MDHKCFYCNKSGEYVVDDRDGIWFLCKKHYKLHIAKYSIKPKKRLTEEELS